MNKAVILVDFEGTLCHDRFWKSLDPETFKKIQNFLFVGNPVIVKDWMRGRYSAEEINHLVAKELDLDFRILWEAFVSDCETAYIDPEVLGFLLILKEKYTLVLFTNNMDSLDRFTIPALNLEKYFDYFVNSHTEKRLLKAEENEENGQTFTDFLQKIGADVSTTCLIDNSRSACKNFEKLGGKSYFVTSEFPLIYWLNKIQAEL